MSGKKVCVVIGVGKGIGSSVAKKFAKEGFLVALCSRNKEKLEPFVKEITQEKGEAFSVAFDTTDEKSVSEGFKEIKDKIQNRPIDVLVYNASSPFKFAPVQNIVPSEFEQSFKATCLGALLSTQQVLPSMLENNKGTIIFTGATASLRGGANFGQFASGKAALRSLAQSLAREAHPKGVHISHVIIDGLVDINRDYSSRPKETFIDPDEVAKTYFHLHDQHPSAWTHELEVRPYLEKF
ncbi:hypothetical protein DICPUDRAFT_91557 [Dictyostelium purpureum]|uniref:Short-chain dehydrogenase/reductase SDR n=1 Tax=Dictyostelium purpureum TaxID=5786 RepID=F0ZE65_DICPU|nr:uncharacterized protein DICPUDRAFT_91557 [Dictyostelium purpureum]EGC37748.1 hypothetical protein DICPUDRAFT_91557 [Dictyostelium purpureum]|eukprot:XP_003285687.1 hypothetical protein DICPUDRAFT_91557 [Dictyostelium purpureum]